MIKMDYREYTVRSADLFNNYEIEANIQRMIEHIKHKGDEALFELTKTFTKFNYIILRLQKMRLKKHIKNSNLIF